MQSPSIPKLEINHDWKSIEHVKKWYWYHSLYCSMKARDDPSKSIHVGIYVSLNVVNQGMFGNHLLSTFSQLDAFPMSSQVRNDNSSRFGKFIEVTGGPVDGLLCHFPYHRHSGDSTAAFVALSLLDGTSETETSSQGHKLQKDTVFLCFFPMVEWWIIENQNRNASNHIAYTKINPFLLV